MDKTSLFVTTSNDFVLSDTIEEIFEVEEDVIQGIKKLNDFDYVIYIKDKFRELVYDKMMKLKKIIIERHNDIFIISLNKSQNYVVPRLTVLVHKKMSNKAVQSVINKYISDEIVYSCSELITNHESKNTKIVLLTATPMYNISSEIVWLMNILLLNDKRAPLRESDIFQKDGIRINVDEDGSENTALNFRLYF